VCKYRSLRTMMRFQGIGVVKMANTPCSIDK